MSSKYGSKVGPLVVCGLHDVLHVNQTPHCVKDQCELLHPKLIRFHLAQQIVGKDLHEVAQSRVTDVCLKSRAGVEEAGGYVPPKCRSPCEDEYDDMLKLVLEPIDSAESRERDSVAAAANEEGQETLVSSLCPLVGIVDIHRGHELTDQPRVENMWVSGHVPHTQLFEQVLEVWFDAQR